MNSDKKYTSSSSSRGVSFTGLLTLLLITLKLTHYIDWSWWWIVSPILIPAIIAVIAITIGLIWITVKS